MKLKTVFPLLAIIGTMWALVLIGSVLIFYFVVPLELPSLGRTLTGVVKALLGGILGILWLFIFVKLRDAYASKLFK